MKLLAQTRTDSNKILFHSRSTTVPSPRTWWEANVNRQSRQHVGLGDLLWIRDLAGIPHTRLPGMKTRPGDWEAARWPFVIGPWRIPTRRLLIVQWHEHGASRPPIVNNCTPLCLPPFFFWGEERGVCCISFNLAPTADRRKAWLLLPPSLVLYSKQTLTLQAICYKLLRYKKRKNSIQVIITNLLQNYCITSLLLH